MISAENIAEASVLLIEDNPGDVRLIGEMLAEEPPAPYQLHSVGRLSQGLEYLAANDTALVLLDLSLPDGRGLDTLARVSAHSPLVPIIVLTGNDSHALALSAVQGGAQDYLVKGRIDRELLLRTMQYSIERKKSERQRRQSEAKYAAIFATTPDAIAIARERDAVQMEVNEAWLRITRYSREQAIGRSAIELGLWSDAAQRGPAIARLNSDGVVENFPAQFKVSGGHAIDVLLSGAKVELDGEACVAWSWRDVTELKRAEVALVASENLYRSLFQAAMDCIIIVSPEGRLLDVNEFCCKSLGYSKDELQGGSVDRILDVAKLNRLMPRAATVATERRSVRAEQDFRAKSGDTRTVEFVAGPLPDGNILVVARDISERRRNESLVMELARGLSAVTGRSFFQALVLELAGHCGADFAFVGEIVPPENKIVRTHAFVAQGSPAPGFEYDLEGSPCIEAIRKRGTVVVPEGVADLYPQDVGLRRRGVEGYVGTSLFAADGTALGIMVVMFSNPVKRAEFCASVLELFAARAAAEIERDRSEQKVRAINASLEARVAERTAELEAANRDLESFSYSISHDLRAPLGAINGFAHLLQSNEGARMSEDGGRVLAMLAGNAERSTELIEGLLRFSRLGRAPVTKTTVSMTDLAREVLQVLQSSAGAAHAEVRIGELPNCLGERVLLRQVWSNLLSNALKYSRGRDPAIVEVDFDGDAGEYRVRDNGAGFDPRYAQKLFEVFERLHTDAEFEGTGVGLAIVKRIIERHGGSIRAEGVPDQGATFRFSLPA